jgi:hypothetical protein
VSDATASPAASGRDAPTSRPPRELVAEPRPPGAAAAAQDEAPDPSLIRGGDGEEAAKAAAAGATGEPETNGQVSLELHRIYLNFCIAILESLRLRWTA